MVYKKNDIIEVVIDGLGNEGEGVGHVDGFPFFIKDTALGDRVKALVMKVKKNLGYAKLLSVEEPSPCRTEPVCRVSSSCGGCTLQHISYEAELKYKEDKVFNCLLRIGGISEDLLKEVKEPIAGMEEPYRYRNKAQYPIGRDKAGKAVAGFYSGRTHHIVPEDDCALSPVEFSGIVKAFLAFLDEYRVSVYDESTGEGLIRHLLIRKGFNTGEIMVCIVSAGKSIPHCEVLTERLTEIPGVVSVCLNVNPDKTNVILGEKVILLSGKPYIEDVLCGIRFRISALSFYQVNPVMTEKLYLKAMEYASIGTDPEISEIWDLCCGIGTISLTAASLCPHGRVHGVEIVPQAVRDAEMNAELNNIKNADFAAADAGEYMSGYLRSNPGANPDIVFLDPPRKGLAPELISSVVTMSPKRIVYISCDPATLARDLKLFTEAGYSLKRYRPFDQFPRTSHVETCVLLVRESICDDDMVSIKVNLEGIALDQGRYVPPAKPTYKNIKQWIFEKYSFNVSTLYIAQIKDKVGMEKRKNYNPGSGEGRVPICPPEKEEAIMDAFRHFGLI